MPSANDREKSAYLMSEISCGIGEASNLHGMTQAFPAMALGRKEFSSRDTQPDLSECFERRIQNASASTMPFATASGMDWPTLTSTSSNQTAAPLRRKAALILR